MGESLRKRRQCSSVLEDRDMACAAVYKKRIEETMCVHASEQPQRRGLYKDTQKAYDGDERRPYFSAGGQHQRHTSGRESSLCWRTLPENWLVQRYIIGRERRTRNTLLPHVRRLDRRIKR